MKQYRDKDGEWVELIPDNASGNLGLIANRDLSRVIFNVEADTLGEVKTYRFVHSLEGGRRIEKEFVIHPDRYDVDMNVAFFNFSRNDLGGQYKLLWETFHRCTPLHHL